MAQVLAPASISVQPALNNAPIKSVDDMMLPMARSDSGVENGVTLPNGVRILGLHEWKEAALSLAESFAEDHSSMYFIETPDREHWTKEQKWDLHLKMMEYITYAHLLKGLVVSAGPNYDCVALW